MSNAESIDVVKLLEEIKHFTEEEQACIAMHCIVEVFNLHPSKIGLNYSRLMYSRSSDRLVEVFEEDFFYLRPSQKRWLGKQLIDRLWPDEYQCIPSPSVQSAIAEVGQ